MSRRRTHSAAFLFISLFLSVFSLASFAKNASERLSKIPPRKKLITGVNPGFVDPGGLTGIGNSQLGSSEGAGESSGAPLGGNGKNGKGQGKGLSGLGGLGGFGSGGAVGGGSANSVASKAPQKNEFDDTASKNSAGPLSGGNGGAGGGGSIGNGAGAGNPTATADPQWYPMCLFLDPRAVTQQAANTTIREMTRAMHECGVNLVVFPVTVLPGSYTNSHAGVAELNTRQSEQCNIAGNVDNATRASTSTCVLADQMSDWMCEQKIPDPTDTNNPPRMIYDTKTAGCAQMNSVDGGQDLKNKIIELKAREAAGKASGADAATVQRGKDATDRIKEIEDHNKGTASSSSPIAPSIEDSRACNYQIVSHEAIGHSMFGHPNGTGDGFGIGFEKDQKGMGTSWDNDGCIAIRKNAFRNDGKWKYDPNRQTYYTEPKDPASLWDFRAGKKLFGPHNDPPLAGPTGTPPILQRGGKTIVMDDNVPKTANPSDQKTAGKAELANATPDVTDPRHKRRPGIAGADNKQGTPVSDPSLKPNLLEKPRLPGPNGKPIATKSVSFDDGAAKNSSSTESGSSVGSIGKSKIDAPPGENAFAGRGGSLGGGNGGSDSAYFDDEATKTQPSTGSQSPTGSGSAGSARGGSFGFDDSAAKSPGGSAALSASGDRNPASTDFGSSGYGGGKFLGVSKGSSSAGLSGSEFFKNIGRDDGNLDETNEEILRKRRSKSMAERLKDGEGLSRRGARPQGERTPRVIGGGE